MTKGLIFDFDGVIVHSLDIKAKAFHDMYVDYGSDIAEKVVDYHLKNGGVSRFEKFKYFHEHFLGIKLSSAELNKLAKQFSDVVVSKVIKCDYVAGVHNFLCHSFDKYKLFISTGTPNGEIKTILESKGIAYLFDAIYGSPDSKIDHVKSILAKNKYKPEELVFFGDSRTDFDAATHYNIRFILIKNKDNINLQKTFGVQKINNFEEFNFNNSVN